MFAVPSPSPAPDVVPVTGDARPALIFALVAVLVIVLALAGRKKS